MKDGKKTQLFQKQSLFKPVIIYFYIVLDLYLLVL